MTPPPMSDDFYAYEWLNDFALQWAPGTITTIGRRWLSRTIWHLEDLVESQLRAK